MVVSRLTGKLKPLHTRRRESCYFPESMDSTLLTKLIRSRVSPLGVHPEPNSERKQDATGDKLEAGDLTKTTLPQNEAAFANNQTVSADAQDDIQAPEPEISQSSTDAKMDGSPTTEVEMGDAPVDAPGDETSTEAAKEVIATPSEENTAQEPTAQEPTVPTESNEPPVLEPSASETPVPASLEDAPSKPDAPLAAAPEEDATGDVEMDDDTAPAVASASIELPEGTQDTIVSNATAATPAEDLSLHPSSMSSLAIDTTQISPTAVGSADVSMSDAPHSPLKISREREEDGADEPAAKRVKTADLEGDVVQVKTSLDRQPEASQPETEQSSLFTPDGEPKSLADKSLNGNSITPWQARKIRGILAGIKKTKAGGSFKQPVEIMWPALWQEYQAKVPDPIDIGTMEKRLKGGDPNYKPYPTLGDFKNDLQLLYDNSVRFNGEVHDVTRSAQTVRDQVLEKMATEQAVEVVKTDKRETVKHHPTRHPAPRAAPPPPPPPPPVRRPVAKPVATSPAEKPAESPAFAIPPNNNGVPLIRRDSTKNADDRPKRPIHPPKNKDLGYEPKKKKKLSPEFRFCDEVLTELRKAKYYDLNQAFLAPVDPIALNIPNYHKVIKKPMDMQTMGEKLHSGQYSNPKDFEKDFSQIIKNCKLFNGEEHFVTKQALDLEKLFKREWAKKDEWMAKHAPATVAPHASAASPNLHDDSEEEDAESEAEADDEKEQSSATLDALQRRLDEENDKLKAYMKSKNPDMIMVEVSQSLVATLQRQIIQERLKLSAGAATSKKSKSKPTKGKKAAAGGKKAAGSGNAGGAGNTGGGGAGGASRKAGGGSKKAKRSIGTLEKEVIAQAIPNLDGDLLNKAIDIIKRDTNENVSRQLTSLAPPRPPFHHDIEGQS